MLVLGEKDPVPGHSRTLIEWGLDESINPVLTREFPPEVSVPPDRERKFSGFFTLRDMERLSGFQIQWTNDIADHLTIEFYPQRKIKTVVSIFQHAVALKELAFG